MVHRVSRERISEVKSRLRREAVKDFIEMDLIGCLAAAIFIYWTVKQNLIFATGAYLFSLIMFFLNRQLWVSYNAKIIVNHFSVELTENSMIYRQGYFERIFDLRDIEYEINRYNGLTIKSKHRKAIDIVLNRQICSIPPETNQYQDIIDRLETVANTAQPSPWQN